MAEKCVMKNEDRADKLRNILVSEIPNYLQAHGRYGNIVVSDCVVTKVKRSEIGFHAASEMYSGKIKLQKQINEETIETVQNLIVKAMPGREFVRVIQNSVDQFFNETVLYSNIAPMLLEMCGLENSKNGHVKVASELFAKCFYASNDVEKGMLVLEDLRDAGYKIGGGKDMFMDYDHILLAVQGLARFHALSYAAKLKNPKMFEEKVAKISRDSKRFFIERKSSDGIEWSYIVYIRFTTRLLFEKFFEENKQENGRVSENLNKVISKVSQLREFGELLKDLLKPEEPLSVLSHGDFNMNNMLFRYDSDNKPVGVKFLDFQNMRYCSPMIDFCFMVYVNSGPKLRAEFWTLFKLYHGTLLEALTEFMNCPPEALLPTFSLEAFEEECAKYCLFGFIFASNFIISSASMGTQDDPFDKFDDFEWTIAASENFMKESLILETEELKNRLYPLAREVLEQMKI